MKAFLVSNLWLITWTAILLPLPSCTTLYHDGKPVIRTAGNLEYRKTATTETLTVNHSAVIQSYGTATAKAAGAIGAAVTSVKLIP